MREPSRGASPASGQARLLVSGLCLYWLGVGTTALLMLIDRQLFGLLVVVPGLALIVLGGGLRASPSTPLQFYRVAQATGWPPLPVTAVAMAILAATFTAFGFLIAANV